jgi:transposase
MKLHGNAALSWSGRRLLAERVLVGGWTLTAAAEAAGVSVRCARKWVGRYRSDGERGLLDRSSAPRRVANRTATDRVAAVLALRRLRMTAAEIAETLSMPLSTVSAVLRRSGMGRLGRIGLEQSIRYERSKPGELVHIDVKKLGRIEGGAGKRVGGRLAGRSRPRRRDAAVATAARSAGSSSTSPSTITAGSPTPRCSRTRKPAPRSAFCTARSLSTAATGSRSSGSSPTTAAPTSRRSTPSAAAASASATCAHDHAAHRQTARQSASSAPSSTAGPTAPSTAQATNAPKPLTAGSGTTTINADTQPSATNPRSAEPTCLGPTPRRPRRTCGSTVSASIWRDGQGRHSRVRYRRRVSEA